MVLVTQNTLGGLGRGIEQAGQSLGTGLQNALQKSASSRASKERGSILQDVIMKASTDPITGETKELSPSALIQALTQAQSQGVPQEDIKSYADLYSKLGKQAAQPSIFEKTFQKNTADKIFNTVNELGQLEGTQATLDRLKDLDSEVQGFSGYLPTDATKEFNALGLAAIEPVLKIFNPRGAIPQQKIELVKNMFAPKGSDLQGTRQGKIRALESFAEKAQKQGRKFLQLVEKYGSNIPLEEFARYEQEANKILDDSIATFNRTTPTEVEEERISDQPGEITEQKEILETLPAPTKYKGKVFRHTETGKRYKSDGKKWSEVK